MTTTTTAIEAQEEKRKGAIAKLDKKYGKNTAGVDPTFAAIHAEIDNYGGLNDLPSTLQIPQRVAELVLLVDWPLIHMDFSSQPWKTKQRRISRVCKLAVQHDYFSEFMPKHKVAHGILKLWWGCVGMAKTIALQTRAGPNTAEYRTEVFNTLLDTALNPESRRFDEVILMGFKAAPNFLELRGEQYSFEGVPGNAMRILGWVSSSPSPD